MKVFIAGFDTETNTFSPFPTGYQTFAEHFIAHGDATRQEPNYCSAQLHVWRRRAEARGWTVVESLCAVGEPGGTMVRRVYEGFRDEILDDLAKARPVDMVLLALHGAMVADGYDDCEGDILSRVRAIVGADVAVGAELDLHCHLTDAMLKNASVLITYKEYPHVDIPERAEELFTLIADAAEGKTRPSMAVYDCRMISMHMTPVEPMRSYVARMQALEGKNGVLSVSLGHGFPWGDVADVGTKTLVVTDHDPAGAAVLAATLGRELFALRGQTVPRFLGIDEALDRALEVDGGPVVLADVSDNAGGGAPGDSTFILRRILDRGISNVASASYWDPVAVRFCMEAGEGATFDLRIGGKSGVASGDPVDLRVTVKKLSDNLTQHFGSAVETLGTAAWVSANGVDLILNTVRSQTFHPEAMTNLGLDPTTRKIVVVKSKQHFYAGFAPIAKEILYVSAPGALAPNYDRIPYTKLTRPYWPKVENPFAV
jgi:microcystin degradation protein MlrC